MFTRNLSSASVCLRCRLRLLLYSQNPRSFPAISAASSSKPRQSIPSLRDIRYFATESSASAPAPAPTPTDYEVVEHLQGRQEGGQEGEQEGGQEGGQEGEAQGQRRNQEQNQETVQETAQETAQEIAQETVQDPIQGIVQDETPFSRLERAATENEPEKRPTPSWIKRYDSSRKRRPKRHVSGGRILTEATERLDAPMLGKPAHAIVMKEGVFRKKRLPLLDLDDEHEPTNIESLLGAYNEPATLEEARANIDELRPTTETSLTRKEFRKLQNTLTKGFLRSQLKDYIQEHRAAGRANAAAQPYKWIKAVSPWVPLNGDSNTEEEIDRSLRGYLPQSSTEKERMVVQIMRECWGLSIQELSSGLGETQVWVQPSQFILLMREQPSLTVSHPFLLFFKAKKMYLILISY